MNNLPTRQAETLAQKLLKLMPSKGLDGRYVRTAAGYSGLIGRMYREGLLDDRYGGKVTLEGCAALEANLDKLPAIDPTIGNIEAVRTAIASRRAELEGETRHAQEAAERYQRDRAEKLERKAAAIPARFVEVLRECAMPETALRFGTVPPEKLVTLWRAIIAADRELGN